MDIPYTFLLLMIPVTLLTAIMFYMLYKKWVEVVRQPYRTLSIIAIYIAGVVLTLGDDSNLQLWAMGPLLVYVIFKVSEKYFRDEITPDGKEVVKAIQNLFR